MSQSVIIPARTNRSFLFVGVLITIIGMAMWTVSFIPASGLAPNQTLTQASIVGNPFAGLTNIGVPNTTLGVSWQDAQNAGRLDSQYASAHLAYSSSYNCRQTSYLAATLFNFNIPSDANITGVIAQGYIFSTVSGQGTVTDYSVKLIEGQTLLGANRANTAQWPYNSASPYTWGGSGDTWGYNLQPNDVDRSDFGVAISANMCPATYSGGVNAFIDFITVTVYYSLPAGQLAPVGVYTTETSCINSGCQTYTYVRYPTTAILTESISYWTSTGTTTITSPTPILTTTTAQQGNITTVTNTGNGQTTTITTTSLNSNLVFGNAGFGMAGVWLTFIGIVIVIMTLGAGALAGLAKKK